MPTQSYRAGTESIDCLDVLVVCSAPVDVRPALNLAEELAHLEEEVRRAPVPIRLRRVFPPTLEQLQRELSPNALRLRQPRVFHFLGSRPNGAGSTADLAQVLAQLDQSSASERKSS